MHIVGRRNFLAGLGLGTGAHLLGAMWRQMLPEALGQAKLRKRFVLFTSANGMLPNFYKQAARSETDFTLNEVFKPFVPYQKEMLILSPLYNPFDICLHGGNFGPMCMQQSPDPRNAAIDIYTSPGGITIDRLLGKKIGGDDPFSAIFAGPSYGHGGGVTSSSADGPRKITSGWTTPAKAYDALFRGGVAAPTGVDASKLVAQNRSALDFLTGDIGRMNGRLSAPERAKLDQYLESVRGLEKQLAGLTTSATADCKSPPAPPVTPDTLDPNEVRALNDLSFTALLCGLTHVAHIGILAEGGPHIPYTWLGDTVGEHIQNHNNNIPMLTKIHQFKYGEIAHMLDRLHQIPEGGGKMSDNTLVAYTNVTGGNHHNGNDNFCVLLFGSAGGVLRTGRYITYPAKKYSMADVWVTAANAVGANLPTFGDPAHNHGGLPDLTA